MGALRVNLTDGTSTFIDLTDSTLVEVLESNINSFIVRIIKPAGTTDYTINRFKSSIGTTSEDITWPLSMNVAYTKIAINPIKFGYPNLGTDKNKYIQYDDEKFVAAAISSALNSSQEPAVLSNRTAIDSAVSSQELGKKLVDQIMSDWDSIQAEADAIEAECKDTTDQGNTFTGSGCECPSLTPGQAGVGGANVPCCEACKNAYLADGAETVTDIGGPIIWRHQYLYDSVSQGA